MALQNKTAIETEYVAKRDGLRAITPGTVTSSLSGLGTLATNAEEAVMVLRAREDLNGRSIAYAQPFADKVAQLRQLTTDIRAAVDFLLTIVPD